MQKFKLDFTLLTTADHAASFALLTGGQADTFATDDVLLYGLLAQHNGDRASYMVVGEFLSYDPYGDHVPQRRCAARQARQRHLPSCWPPTARSSAATPAGSCASCRSTVSLDLPMSPQLESCHPGLGLRTE